MFTLPILGENPKTIENPTTFTSSGVLRNIYMIYSFEVYRVLLFEILLNLSSETESLTQLFGMLGEVSPVLVL